MSYLGIFIDTGGFVATRNEDDENYNTAKEMMKSILKNEYGAVYTSDYVFNETVTIAYIRTQDKKFSIDLGNYILKSKIIRLIFATIEDFNTSWDLFLKYKDKKLSFTDCNILSIMNRLNIEYIFSYDSHFDGFKKRLL